MQYFATVMIILIFVFALWLVTNSEHRNKMKNLFKKSSTPKITSPYITQEEVAGSNGTRICPDLIIHQLAIDKKGNAITIKTFPLLIKQMSESGFYISGCNHNEGDAILSKCPEAEVVSRNHLGIGYDDEGFFAVDNNSSNKTYLLSDDGKHIKQVTQFDIKNGTTVCLGKKQWIRFTLNEVENFTPNFNNTLNRQTEPKTQIYSKPTRLTRN